MNDEEKARRRAIIRRDVIGFVLLIIVLYFLVAIALSIYVGHFVHTSVENRGEGNPYPELMSDRSFQKLSCETYYHSEPPEALESGEKTKEYVRKSPVFTLWYPTGGKSYYTFSYKVTAYTNSPLTDGRTVTGTGCPVEVCYDFRGGKLNVTAVNYGGYG